MYADRRSAGRSLAGRLATYATDPAGLVLGLPRGGVVVAAEVAAALDLRLDVCVVRKLGVPGHEELAFGAIAAGGAQVLNAEVVAAFRLSEADIAGVVRREQAELARREQAYRGATAAPLDVAGRRAILVDDGLATGATMRAAVLSARAGGAGSVIVAVPVGAAPTVAMLEREVDTVVCAHMPEHFVAVGQWYDEFGQTTDAEVRDLLAARR